MKSKMKLRFLGAVVMVISLVTQSFGMEEKLEQSSEFKGNWTETFMLSNGKPVIHTPTYVKFEFMQGGKALKLNGNINGMDLSGNGLHLLTDSTREEFVEALKRSGFYQ